jgi:glucuronate isomerase
MGFITEEFLLQSSTARRLYHDFAEGAPIVDFHCHLSAREIAENRSFRNLTEIWLDGDHYKWRAMRLNGVSEQYCTGSASPYDKFIAWCRTAPKTLRNPLYHWTHLELLRYFEIDELLDERSAPGIWDRANRVLASEQMRAQGILTRFGVSAVCTTDDPTDSLKHHDQLRDSALPTQVFPAFRPDASLRTESPAAFREWTAKLGSSANIDISKLSDFLNALSKRHDEFHKRGCRISDHGLNQCPTEFCDEKEAAALFARVFSGKPLQPEESTRFAGFMMLFFGRLDAQKGWTKQLHLGAYRNANSRMMKTLGRDTGFDAIGDWQQVDALAKFLDRLDSESSLPRVIIFNLNPVDNYAFATMTGCFTEENIRGKVQFGTGWWFLDQKEGIEWQVNALSHCGLLSSFVGMVTDSRSFMSFPRHEYFRRIFCNLIAGDVEAGLLPDDDELLGGLIKDVCFNNAVNYLRLPLESDRSETAALQGVKRS